MMKFLKRVAYRLFPAFRPQTQDNKAIDNDIFFVNGDGSISLNHDSDIVKRAFSENIAKLRKIDIQEK